MDGLIDYAMYKYIDEKISVSELNLFHSWLINHSLGAGIYLFLRGAF